MPNDLWWDLQRQQLAALLRLMPDFDRSLSGEAAYDAFVAYPIAGFAAPAAISYRRFAAMDWCTFAAVLGTIKETARDHWFDALKDTQRALTTGELVDRETRRVIRKVTGGWRSLNDDQLRSECSEVSRILRDFHNKVHDAITSGALVKHDDGRLTIRDHQIGLEFTHLRDECVSKMSQTLTSVGMAPI